MTTNHQDWFVSLRSSLGDGLTSCALELSEVDCSTLVEKLTPLSVKLGFLLEIASSEDTVDRDQIPPCFIPRVNMIQEELGRQIRVFKMQLRQRWSAVALGVLAMQVRRLTLYGHSEAETAQMDREVIEMKEIWDQENLPCEDNRKISGIWKGLKHPVWECRCIQCLMRVDDILG